MKPKTIFACLVFFLVAFSHSAIAQKADISGEWKLNREKTVMADNQLFLSRVSIQLKSDSLLTTRVYENEYGEEYPFKENLSLNGKDCKIFIYDMPRTSKATRSNADGSVIIESTTTFYGNNGEENLTAKETWKVDNEGKTLTIAYTNIMSGGETVGTNIYNRVK